MKDMDNRINIKILQDMVDIHLLMIFIQEIMINKKKKSIFVFLSYFYLFLLLR